MSWIFNLEEVYIRGPAKSSIKKAKSGTNCFNSVRSLIRLGILPAVSALDNSFLSLLNAVIAHHDIVRNEIALSNPTLDPYFEIRIPEVVTDEEDVSDTLYLVPISTSQMSDEYSKKMLNAQRFHSTLASYSKPVMLEMAKRLLGPEPREHRKIIANLYDAAECIRGGQIRNLLLKDPLIIPEEMRKASTTWDFDKRCILGIKLLCIVYAGVIALFKHFWNDSNRVRGFAQRLVHPWLYKRAKALDPAWDVDSIKELMFTPSEPIDWQNPKSMDLAYIGSHYERVCTVQLESVLFVSNSELRGLRGKFSSSISETHQVSISDAKESQVPSSVNGELDRFSVGNSTDNRGINAEKVDAENPWSLNIKWQEYMQPVMTAESPPEYITAYENDFNLLNDCKQLIYQVGNSVVSLEELSGESCGEQAVTILINRMIQFADSVEKLPLRNTPKPRNGFLVCYEGTSMSTLYRKMLATKLKEQTRQEA
jgi:hypothetical protein